MPDASNIIVYIFLFISLYYEIFLLITYFERRFEMQEENIPIGNRIKKYPTASIIVPCWNEEKTISKTIHSLLNLDYPKNKLQIIVVDDGSTDGTWKTIQKFQTNPQISIHRKENGGKYTALNFGLTLVTSELVGCLDADSYVDKDALKHIVLYFQNDKEVKAVTPSVQIWKPETILQMIQKVEYGWGTFVRKMLSYLGAMYVTPGPFSIFRTELFAELGGYRHAHQTEDMELALRLQTNHYKMVNAHNARVYTVAPRTLGKLYKQRLRWTYGFIKNTFDYKFLLFRKEYGNLGMFVLPIAFISLFSSLYIVISTIGTVITKTTTAYVKWQTIGFDFKPNGFSFDWFYVHTEVITIMSIIVFIGTLTILFTSRKMAEGHRKIGMDVVYFLALYSFIAPLWLGKALFNAAFSVKTNWR